MWWFYDAGLCYYNLMNPQEYLKFLEDYLLTLESLAIEIDKKDEKFAAELRTAERSFNFLLDNFPGNVVEDVGMEKWNEIKKRRDLVANTIAGYIENNPEVKKRFEAYCEALKNPGQLSSLL